MVHISVEQPEPRYMCIEPQLSHVFQDIEKYCNRGQGDSRSRMYDARTVHLCKAQGLTKSQRIGIRSSFIYTFQILKYSVGSLTKQCLEFTDTILHILAAKSICVDHIVTFCALRVD